MAIVTNKKARKSFIEVLKCFFGRKIRMLWEIYFLYIGIINILVFKIANMGKYIFKRYYYLDGFFGTDYLHKCSCRRG